MDFIYDTNTESKELAALAHELECHFSILCTAVLQSLVDNKVKLSDAKQSVHLSLVLNNSRPQTYRASLEGVKDMDGFFTFLIVHHFIGYLNYALLRRISQLANDISLKKQFEQYEDKYTALFTASFKDIMKMFDQYPDRRPLTPIGLPPIVFELKEQWLMKHFFTWVTSMAEFPWFDSCFFCGLKEICVHIIYAALPSAVPAILKDLRDPLVLKKLEYIGVTVVQLPDGGNDNKIVSLL